MANKWTNISFTSITSSKLYCEKTLKKKIVTTRAVNVNRSGDLTISWISWPTGTPKKKPVSIDLELFNIPIEFTSLTYHPNSIKNTGDL